MRRSAAALCFLVLVLMSPALRADGVRCAENLVELGETEAQVREKCGEPTTRQRKTFKARQGRRGGIVTTTWDEWIYDLGPTAFVRILTFDVATTRLIHVELGDYGR